MDVRRVQFSELRMRDARRAAHFGWLYGYESWKIEPGPAIPEFLHGLSERAAALVRVEAGELVENPGDGVPSRSCHRLASRRPPRLI